ncbi:OprO/OprP family phosphate-selective porin [Archangium lipolyticum]|uniref:OprO/OprP family phosphate-selective porin n=1 Tax=Archangium lipolyticum TaxID=2970465 RepID=UPI002149E2A0|nr:OprO/OprP family phosphate-selective porin [Archangium lipolyticum]
MGEGFGVGKGRRAVLASVLLLGMPVWAAEQKPAADAAKPEATSVGEEPLPSDAEKAAGEEKKGLRVRPFGRVFARVSADERNAFERSLSIPSARVGLAASLSHVDAEVTADLSSKTMLKDAYLRVSDGKKRLRLYGGQFKAPFLARELESAWQLPLMRRGLVADYLEDEHDLGGRRLGLMGEVSLKNVWKLKVSGGVFQGAKDDDTGVRASEDAALRVSARPLKFLSVGASTYLTQVFQGTRHHAVAADTTLHLGGLEVSGEYVNGRLAVGTFSAQLGLASYTLPVGLEGWALQPVVGAESLQLQGPLKARGYGLVGGLNVLYSEHFKAQFQAERALRPGDEAPGFEYSLQLATRF